MSKRVLILQEYVPEYRLPFFRQLRNRLGAEDVELVIAAGAPPREQARRGDAAVDLSGILEIPSWHAALGPWRFSVQRPQGALRNTDLVIVEQALRNALSYRLALAQRVHGPPMALWGHGGSYTTPRTGVERVLERWFTRRAHWFFVYTAGGRERAIGLGARADGVTVVQNSIDTSTLRSQRLAVTHTERTASAAKLEITLGRTCLFVGALDKSKRIDFLLSAGGRIAESVPDFSLIIAGDGPLRGQIEEFGQRNEWVRYVGRADDAAKARLASVSELLLMPGRVGLVAVDSFALQTPIVTTMWGWHAPEFEYLQDGRNAVITANHERSFAETVVRMISRAAAVDTLRAGCVESSKVYTLEAMVTRFAEGVYSALNYVSP